MARGHYGLVSRKKLETIRDASNDTGIPQSRLYELVAKAKKNPGDPTNIPYVLIESRIYFRAGALDSWIASLEVVSARGPASFRGNRVKCSKS